MIEKLKNYWWVIFLIVSLLGFWSHLQDVWAIPQEQKALTTIVNKYVTESKEREARQDTTIELLSKLVISRERGNNETTN